MQTKLRAIETPEPCHPRELARRAIRERAERQTATFRVSTRCILEGCACSLKNGIVLYEGQDQILAQRTAKIQPKGFETTTDEVVGYETA